MARPKKKTPLFKHFTVDTQNKQIIVIRDNLKYLTDEEYQEIKVYEKLDYKLVILEEKPKVKKITFTYDKAVSYIKKNHKKDLTTFESFKEEANKLTEEYKKLKESGNVSDEELKEARTNMVMAQRDAFTKQKEWFKAEYGEEAYNEARLNY